MTRSGTGVLILGIVLAIVGFVTGGSVACTDVGYYGEKPGGFELYGIEGEWIQYTMDGGVNTCSTPMSVLLVPIGIVVAGIGGIVLWRTTP